MDQPGCDADLLANTYRQFRQINPVISRWHFIYKRYLLPCFEAGKPHTLLDIGFGGADILLRLSGWAKSDGIDLHITGIDIDERAVRYAQSLPRDPKIKYKLTSLRSLAEENETYDLVISNHLLHHLDEAGLPAMLKLTSSLAGRRVVFNDIERADLAYLGFHLLTGPLLRNSFARPDGLRSIRRSYTKSELVDAVPAGWQVHRIFPYRLLLLHDL